MKQKIINNFNHGARTYNSSADVQAFVAQQLASRLKLTSVNHILEIGCGTGMYTQHLIKRFPNASLLLTDIASQMVQACQERFSHNTLIKAVCVDGEKIETDKQFDLITSSMTLHWFENFKKGFDTLIKHLTPGGQIVFSMLGSESLYEWREICQDENVAVGTPLFPDKKTLQQEMPNLQIEVAMYKHFYKSAYEYLSSLKALGANTTLSEHTPVSAGKLRQLLRKYADGIEISYEIIYGCYTQS